MIPLGAILLAEDVFVLRKPTMRALCAGQRCWDQQRMWTQR